MTGQQILFSDDRGSPPQPVGSRRTEDFAEDRTYQLPIRVIRIPAWHPRIRPPHLRPDPDFERLVRSVQLRDLCDPLVVRMEGGTVQLVSGVRRYWAMEEIERREGRPVTAPVRFQHVDPRRAMAMAAASNTDVKWSALEESLFAVRMRAEVEQEEGREVTVDELAAELPWCGQDVGTAHHRPGLPSGVPGDERPLGSRRECSFESQPAPSGGAKEPRLEGPGATECDPWAATEPCACRAEGAVEVHTPGERPRGRRDPPVPRSPRA